MKIKDKLTVLSGLIIFFCIRSIFIIRYWFDYILNNYDGLIMLKVIIIDVYIKGADNYKQKF